MSLSAYPPEVLATLPALTPPPGVKSNFIDPESRAHAVIVVSGVFTAILGVFVALRLYAKVFVSKALGWEDAACMVGTMLCIGYTALLSHIFHLGFGAHQWNLHLTVIISETTIKELKATNYLYGPMMIFAKMSILFLFFRIFSTTKAFRIWIYVGIWTTLLNHVVGTFLAIFMCYSNDPIKYSQCAHKTQVLDVVISVINIISDFYILLLPLLVISQLHMNLKRKIGLGAIFFIGFAACICSVTGLIYRIVQWHSDDTSWWLGPLLVLSLMEVEMSLIAGCMPLIPVIFRNTNQWSLLSSWRSRLFSFRGSRSKKSSDEYENKNTPLTAPSKQEGIEMIEGSQGKVPTKGVGQEVGAGLKSEPEEMV